MRVLFPSRWNGQSNGLKAVTRNHTQAVMDRDTQRPVRGVAEH